jgi:hypothetical protein
MLATVIAGAWGRSYAILDSITIPVVDNQSHFLESFNGRFDWASLTHLSPETHKLEWRWNSERLTGKELIWTSHQSLTQYWKYCGFGVWEWRLRNQFRRVLVIPYWPVVLGLTLLSAYLILGKPRKSSGN